ncbi:MAG: hypothetical protein ACE5FJ_03140 [Gemmatimonadales bacterium]
MPVRKLKRLPVVLLVAAACGGGGGGAGNPANVPPPPDLGQDEVAQGPPQLIREEFSYRGGSRDPFASMAAPGSSEGPTAADIILRSVLFDSRYPSRSIAVVRDTVTQVIHRLQIGDPLGRFTVVDIRERDLVLSEEVFGTERQVVLSLRRPGEGIQ